MHRFLSHSTVNSLGNRRFIAGKYRFQPSRSQSSSQVYSFVNLVSMRLQGEDPSLPRVSEKLRKKVYTRDFLLSFMKLDTCRDVPSGADLSVLWKPSYSYGRDFLLSLTGLEVCKRLPPRFNYKVHGAELSHDSKNGGRVSWSSSWNCGESGGSLDGKLDRNSQSEANSDDGKDCQPYYQLAKSSNPYRPPFTSKVEYTEGIEIYICTKEGSISAGSQTKSRSEEDKTGGYSWKKETKACEENREQRGDKHEPVTVHYSENEEGQNEIPLDLVIKAGIRHNTQIPAVHSPDPSRRPLEEVGVLSSNCTNGTSEVYRRREGCVSKPTSATFSQRDEISSQLMKKLTQSADNGAPKQLYVPSEVSKNQGVLACKPLEQSISSNSKGSGSEHQSRSLPDAPELVRVEGNNNISECSSSLQKGVVSCNHETQSSSIHFLVKNGSNRPPLPPFPCKGNEGIPSVRGGLTITALEPVILESSGYDKKSTSTVDKCQPSETISGGSRDASFSQLTDSDTREDVHLSIDDDWTDILSMMQAEQDLRQRASIMEAVQSTFDDDWAEIVSMIQEQQELEHKALAGGQQLVVDEICLPDEDSLISFDECLPEQKTEPKSCPDVTQNEYSSLEYCLPDEESLITCDDLLAPQNLISLFGETKNVVTPPDVTVHKQSPSSGSSERNPRTPSSDASYFRQRQMQPQTKSVGPTSHRPAPKRHSDAQTRHPSRKYGLPRVEPSMVFPVLWPPLVFPHLHHEMLNGPEISTYVAPPVPTYLPYSNSSPPNHLHHGYEVYRMHTPAPYCGSKYSSNRSSGKRV